MADKPSFNTAQRLVIAAEILGHVRGVLEGQTSEDIRRRLRNELFEAQQHLVRMLVEPEEEQP